MPKFVDHVTFDTNLFKTKVGRVELSEEDIIALQKSPTLDDILKQAYSAGFRLVYVFAPSRASSVAGLPADTLPGAMVDDKTTYFAPLTSFDSGRMCSSAFLTPGIRIRKHDPAAGLTTGLRNLAITSGVWSRFKLDDRIPTEGFEEMFEAWANNSVNRSLADEVFIAYDATDEHCTEELGFVTVRRRGDSVNIGLLAVSDQHRRRGIARALLSRAVLWSMEELGALPGASLNVVTQGENAPACACYEGFGFRKETLQEVYHVWLPDDLSSPVVRADQGPIPFCKQHITGKELTYAAQVLSSGLDSAAYFTVLCSGKIRELIGDEASRGVVMTPSGTAALELAALLCEFTAGDEVIMPSYTFSSTANAFVLRGATPVFVDIRRDTLNIDEMLIEAAITPRTRAICAVHYAGVPCEMDAICAIAKKHNLFVIEDAAQGFMSTYKGRQLGTIGDFGCFSFHYTKNVVCGEGGALSINYSDKLAARALIMWEKGTNRHDFMMGKIDKYHWVDVGSSYVPNELSCAVLWAQLEQVHTIWERRRANFAAYRDGLAELAQRGAFRIPAIPEDCETNAHIFYLLLPSESLRRHYEGELQKRGVAAYTHYIALHSAPAGLKYGRSVGSLPVTADTEKVLLRLPMWIDMTAQQLQFVIDSVREIAAALPAELH